MPDEASSGGCFAAPPPPQRRPGLGRSADQPDEPMNPADRIRIAVAQTDITIDPAENGRAIHAAMRTAAGQGARLVHCSEGSLSGYAGAAKAHFSGWHINWDLVTAELHRTMDLARELRLWVAVGGNHRLEHARKTACGSSTTRASWSTATTKDTCPTPRSAACTRQGFSACTFEVDGFRFGALLCVEVQFGELWVEQRDLGVDCVLFSTYSEDPIFEVIARGYAAANTYWVSVAVPAPCSTVMASAVIGPHGQHLVQARAGQPDVLCIDLDRADPNLDIALNKARPWRLRAASGDLYAPYRSSEPRSIDHTKT